MDGYLKDIDKINTRHIYINLTHYIYLTRFSVAGCLPPCIVNFDACVSEQKII